MRVPSVERRRRPLGLRGWLIGAAILLLVLLFSLRGLARFYTDYLWFKDVRFTDTWRALLYAKVVPAVIFSAAFFVLMLVNLIGYLAEAAYHHPDLSVTYAKVWVKLKTHSAGGITDKDFALAKQIEAVALWRPPAGGVLEGNPNKFVKGS